MNMCRKSFNFKNAITQKTMHKWIWFKKVFEKCAREISNDSKFESKFFPFIKYTKYFYKKGSCNTMKIMCEYIKLLTSRLRIKIDFVTIFIIRISPERNCIFHYIPFNIWNANHCYEGLVLRMVCAGDLRDGVYGK